MRPLSTRTMTNEGAKHMKNANEVAKDNNNGKCGSKHKNNDKWC